MTDKIIDRLRKLIRQEQSARSIGSIGEAEAFAAKIQETLDAYNLAMSDIDINESRSSVDGNLTSYKVQQNWQLQLLSDICDLNGCRMILAPPFAAIVGSDVDRNLVNELYPYFENLGLDLLRGSIKEFRNSPYYQRKRKKHRATLSYKDSFLLGYTIALTGRLRSQHEESMAAASISTALIYIGNKLADADAFISKNLQIERVPVKMKRSTFRDPAFFAGLEAGGSVALTSKALEVNNPNPSACDIILKKDRGF